MALEVTRKMFSIDEYEQMIEAGILKEDDRVELIRGEILEMAPIGTDHAVCVTRLEHILHRKVNVDAVVWSQNPIRLLDASEPQPDLVLIKWRSDFYAGRLPTPEDIILLIEVSDTTLAYDRRVKLPLYAEAEIPEVWIVNLPGSAVEVYSEPAGSTYRNVRRAKRGELLTLPGGLAGEIAVGEVLE